MCFVCNALTLVEFKYEPETIIEQYFTATGTKMWVIIMIIINKRRCRFTWGDLA